MLSNSKAKWKLWWEKIKQSFQLTTTKISLIALFLTLTVVVSLFEIPLLFFAPYLTIDFGITITLLSVLVLKLPYGLLIAIVAPWLRLIIPHTVPPDAIGELSYMLGTITVLVVYFSLSALIKILVPDQKYSSYFYWVTLIINLVITCVITSLLNSLYNYLFLLDLYGASSLKSIIWPVFFPFNLFKFSLVLFLFVFLQPPLLKLQDRFDI